MSADFTMYSGDTKLLEITVLDQDGDPVDLTGATVKWQMAKKVTSDTPVLSKEIGSGVVIMNPTAGRFDISLQPADTAAIKGAYYHEAEITESGGDVATVLAGTITILPDLIQ